MNEELQKTLSSLIEKSLVVAQDTGTWAMDKAPELIEQYLMWEFWSSAFFFGMGIICLVVSLILINIFRKKWDSFDSDEAMGAVLFSSISLLIGVALTTANLYTMIFIKVAPEIYLIKQFM